MEKKLLSMTRRSFFTLSGACSALFMFSGLFKAVAFSSETIKERNDLGAFHTLSSATGHPGTLLDIAQVSDVHIIDPDHYLRAKNLKLLGMINLGPLLDKIPTTSRLQDHLTGLTWDAVIRSINNHHHSAPLDFVITTGDHTDTDLEHELRWFVEIADGILPSDYQDDIRHQRVAPIDPEGLEPPWYAVIGNHDIEFMGTFNNELFVGKLVDAIGSPDAEPLSDLNESIEIYKGSTSDPYWHGFADMPAGYPQEGYYSFNPKPYIHCIVLNTANYNSEEGRHLETLSLGVMDRTQFDWMIDEIEANTDKCCLIFSHHGPGEFNPLIGIAPESRYVKAGEFRETLCAYENVIAHINGHTHINRIKPVQIGDNGYWDINTCAIIDYPQEWRRITLLDKGDGTGTIACRMVQHKNQECLDTALSDPNAYPDYRYGTEDDRDVDLRFTIPSKAVQNILDNQPDLPHDNPPDSRPDGTNNPDDQPEDGNGNCFIATATFGTAMEPEVIILRRFRDKVLLNHQAGRLFVKAYYRLSPPVAQFIAVRSNVRSLTRSLLRPIVRLLQILDIKKNTSMAV